MAGTNGKQTVNTFLKGMDLDTDVTLVSKDSYIYAENVRIIVDSSSNTGALHAVEGLKLLNTNVIQYKYYEKDILNNNIVEKYSNFTISKFNIIAVGVIRNYVCIIAEDKSTNNFNYIFRLKINDENIDLTLIASGYFNIGGDEDNQVSITTRWEDYDNIKVYWADGVNPLRYINISEKSDKENFNKNTVYFDSNKSIVLKQPEFNKFVSGSLKSGLIQYAYQLFSKNGSETVLSPLSQMFHLTSSKVGDLNYSGSDQNSSSGKSVSLKFAINDNIYNYCRIFSIHYTDGSNTPSIKIVSEFSLSLNNGYQYFTDPGSFLSELTYEEFVNIDPYYIIPKVIESKFDRLFLANIIEDNWVLPDHTSDDWYDTRSFRFGWNLTNGLYSKVLSNSDSEKIIFPNQLLKENMSDNDWKTFLPYDHDCLNPYNNISFDEDSTTIDSFQYTTDLISGLNMPYIKGGCGRNVDFKIVHTKFGEDYYSKVLDSEYDALVKNTYRGHSRDVDIKNISNKSDDKLEMQYNIRDKESNTYDYIFNTNTGFNKFGPLNYSNPLLSNRFRSYQRDEIYRFGVVFYNEKGQSSPVSWIADIRMPTSSSYNHRLFDQWGKIRYDVNNSDEQDLYQIVNYILGIQFNFRNLPSYIKQLEIVRAKREYSDRSIISQGIIGKCAKETKGSLVSNPLNSMTYADFYELFHWNAQNRWVKNNIFVSYTGNLVTKEKPTVPYVFASSEVSYFGEDMSTYWDNVDGLSVIYGLSSPTQLTWDKTYPDGQSNAMKQSMRRAYESGLFVYNNEFWYNGKNGSYPELIFWTTGSYDGSSGDTGLYAIDAFTGGALRQSIANVGTSDELNFGATTVYGLYSLWMPGYNGHHPRETHPVEKVKLVGKLYSPFTSYRTPEHVQFTLNPTNNYVAIDNSKLATNIKYDEYDNVLKKMYVQSVGTESFQNWTPTKEFSEPSAYNNYAESTDWKEYTKNVKNGAHGPCVFFVSSKLITSIPSIYEIGTTSDSGSSWSGNSDYFLKRHVKFNDSPYSIYNTGTIAQKNRAATINSTFLVNLRKITIPYGGLDYNSRLNTEYISTSFVYDVSGQTVDATVFGGDTFMGINEYIVQHWYYSKEDPEGSEEGDPKGQKAQIVVYYPSESSINLSLVNGSSFFRYANTSNYPYNLSLEPVTKPDGFTQDKPLYTYNSAYSREPDSRLFVSKGKYTEDNKNIDFRVMYSEAKTNDEISDNWLKFKEANYLDVDTRYGSINNMKLFNNNLYFWQDDSFGVLSVNQRSLITDNNIGSLVLGKGDVLDRYDYITTSNGSKKDVIYNNVITPSTMFWYDHDRGEILSFSNQLSTISKEKKVQSLFNQNKDKIKDDIKTLYNKKYNEVSFMFNMTDNTFKHLVYNEQMQAFSSFYTYNPDWFIDLKDNYYTIKDNNIHKVNKGLYNKFYNGIDNTKITNIVNDDPLYTKVFDNIETSGNIELNNFFSVNFKTKTQDSLNISESDVKLREDNYRFYIPRSNETITTDSQLFPTYNDRIRGKYLKSFFNFKPINSDLNIPFIKTSYRISNI